MNYKDIGLAEDQAQIELRALKPSQKNPVPVLVCAYDRLTQQSNKYRVAVCVGITPKTIWQRDTLDPSHLKRCRIVGHVVKVMHAIDSDTLAVIEGNNRPELVENARQQKILNKQRENMLNRHAEDIEAALIY